MKPFSLQAMRESLVSLREGYLEKLAKDELSWKPRMVALQGDMMWYRKLPGAEGNPEHRWVCRSLGDCERVLEEHHTSNPSSHEVLAEVPEPQLSHARVFTVVFSSGRMVLRAPSSTDRDEWMLAIAKQAAIVKENELLMQAERAIQNAELESAEKASF